MKHYFNKGFVSSLSVLFIDLLINIDFFLIQESIDNLKSI